MQIIVIDDKPRCDEHQLQDRKEICSMCEQRIGEICSQCGCLLDRKILYIENTCPIGRW